MPLLLDYYLRGISNDDPASEMAMLWNKHVGAVKKRDLRPPPQTGSVPDAGPPH